MTLWRSGPAPALGAWLLAGLIGWVWSVPFGLLLWLVAVVLGKLVPELALMPMAAALFLLFAPAFSWVGLLIALPMAVGAARRGLFGPGSAALIGTVAGGLAAWALGGTSEVVTAVFGVITLLIVRAVLTRAVR